MSLFKILIINFLSLTFFIPSVALAQTRLQIIDEGQDAPIGSVYFTYGEQSGVSDQQGNIELVYKENQLLYLSHLVYGNQQILPEQLETALQTGRLELSERVHHLQPVTVMSTRAGSGESDITPVGIRDMVNHDAGNFIDQIPGISTIRKSGNYGFDPVLRGFKYDQLNVVIDGVQSANAACPNRMDPATSQVALNMIEQVEVLKGPHSLRYGNSFGGTINFVSSKLPYGSLQPFGRFTGSYESNGNVKRSEGLIGLQSENISAGLFGSWSRGEDYADGDGIEIPARLMRGSIGADIGFKLTESQELNINATRNFARDVDFPALPMDLRSDDTWLLKAAHQSLIGKGPLSQMNSSIYLTSVDHSMDNFDKALQPRMMNAATAAKTKTYGGRSEFTFRWHDSWLFTGLDYRRETADGIRTREFLMGPNQGNIVEDNVWQDGFISNTGWFAEYHLNLNRSHFVFSGRLAVNEADLGDQAEEFIVHYNDTWQLQVNPSFSLGLKQALKNGMNLGVWIGRAQRSAGLTERFINFFPVGLDPYELLGNPQLKPEVNQQLDLSFDWKNEKVKLEASYYISYLDDYIAAEIRQGITPRLPASPGVRQFINSEHAFRSGFEFGFQHRLVQQWQHQLTAAYTYGQDLERNAPLPEIAPLEIRYMINGGLLDNKLQPELMIRKAFDQNRVAEYFGETETPGFLVADLSFTYQLLQNLKLAAGTQNIFDNAYYEHLTRSIRDVSQRPIYAPGRNFFVTLSYRLLPPE